MTTYAYIVEVTGPVPMPEQVQWDAYEAINAVYLEALRLNQVPADQDRVVQVGSVEVDDSPGQFVHRIGWYVNDDKGPVLTGSPYLVARPVNRADFGDE